MDNRGLHSLTEFNPKTLDKLNHLNTQQTLTIPHKDQEDALNQLDPTPLQKLRIFGAIIGQS